MVSKIKYILLIFISVLVLYYPVLSTYFSQDDFFHFKVSQTNNSVISLLNLFAFHSFQERGIAFYRPISREIPFHFYFLIFDLNASPFRVFLFIIHFINIYLVYLLLKKLFNNNALAYFVAFFFGITAANVSTLYYLAGGIQTLLVTLFTLSCLLTFIRYLETNKVKFRILSFIFFILALGSHEQGIIIPFLIFGLLIIYKKNIKNHLIDLFFPFFLIFCFIYLEITKIGFSSGEQQYQITYNLKSILNSLFWYINWAIGIPETLIDFVYPHFKLNPTLLRYWWQYYIFIFPSFFISVITLILMSIYLVLKNWRIFKNKVFLVTLFWFPLGLAPVILLPSHKSTHYLVISLPAFWTIVGFVVFKFFNAFKSKSLLLSKLIFSFLIFCLIILSSASAILGSTNYWAATRGKLAEKLITEVKTTYPSLPQGSVIYFKNDPSYPYLTQDWGGSSKQASTILNGADALQLLYKDPTLKVYYEDINKPVEINQTVHPIVAKIY